MTNQVDLLAIAAHPDDVELTCGGTLIKAAKAGYRTGIVDLTKGEMGTRGSPEIRAAEAEASARTMGVLRRENAALPDARLQNTDDTRRLVVEIIRQFAPTTVILPYPVGRHPDHRVASELIRDACFLSKLKNYPASGGAHRVEKLIYSMSYREDPVKPTFVVDISDEFTTKLAAIRCYGSQFDGIDQAGELFPTGQPLYDVVEIQNAHYGSLIRTAFGEPYMTEETVRVDDVVKMGVQSL